MGKDKGYSVVQIFGPKENCDRATLMINARVAEIDPSKTPQGSVEEIRVDQGIVGYLLGKGGETLKAIKLESGAAIAIDQSTKDQGFSIIRIIGDGQAKNIAHERVLAKINEVKGAQPGVFE